MPANSFVAVIVAGGKGVRMRAAAVPLLQRAGGRPLVEHVVRACRSLAAKKIIVIVGHQAKDVRAVVEPLGAKTVLQEFQRGTGHALQAARKAVGTAKYALVLPGDAPLIPTETLAALMRAHQQAQPAATVLIASLRDPSGYGRVLRSDDGTVAAIVEEKSLTDVQRSIQEVNSSIYCFTLENLWPCLAQLQTKDAHRHFHLTDAIALLNRQGKKVLAQMVSNSDEILGCNTRSELAQVDQILRARKTAELMEAGVTIYLPETVLIDPDVIVGKDTVIEPYVQLLGATRVGSNCRIRAASVISDSVLKDSVTVEPYCMVESSCLGNRVILGPFARLRPGADFRAGVRVGNFVEVKKSVLKEGAKAMRLSYLGDASIGRKTVIGGRTITCNYDGIRKYRTTIGQRVFVGPGTELVAPIKVGDGAYIAAGSTITDDVPTGALAIARWRQVNKAGRAREAQSESAAKAALAKSASARKKRIFPSRAGQLPGNSKNR